MNPPRRSIKALARKVRTKARHLQVAVVSRRNPVLSVIMPVFNGEDSIKKSIESILSQDYLQLEVIVVDDRSTDRTREIVRSVAARDSRVRLVEVKENGGPGRARNIGVDHAKGRYLTFVDADDKVLPKAYGRMLRTLTSTGSDFISGGYKRSGSGGSHRPEITRLVHARTTLSTTLEATPGVLEEPVLWNKIYQTDFWHRSVGPIPEDRNYEDQEPAVKAALHAKQFDVVDYDVYSWTLPDGRETRSQSKRTIEDLQSRVQVIEALLNLADSMPEAGRRRMLATIIGRDLGMYLAEVPYTSDAYWDMLHELVADVFSKADRATLLEIPASDRILAYIGSHGTRADVETIDGAFAEYGKHVPWRTMNQGEWVTDPKYLSELSITVPDWILSRGPHDWTVRTKLWSATWTEHGSLELFGYAYLSGTRPQDVQKVSLSLVDKNGKQIFSLPLNFHVSDWVNIEANDPWTSYESSAFRAKIPTTALPKKSFAELKITLTVTCAGELHSTFVDYPTTEPRTQRHVSKSHYFDLYSSPIGILCISSETAKLSQAKSNLSRVLKTQVLADAGPALESVSVRDDDVFLEGSGLPMTSEGMRLVSSGHEVRLPTEITEDGTWTSTLDLADPQIPSTGLFLQWMSATGWNSIEQSQGLVQGPPLRLKGKSRAIAISRVSGTRTGITLSPPLTNIERSRYGRQQLAEMSPPPLEEAVVYDSFAGKSAGDNPLAVWEQIEDGSLDGRLRAELPPVAPDTKSYWSVVDGTCTVPFGVEPLYVGSKRWFEKIRSAKLLVTNNHLPVYFSKAPDQFWLQTWHGTPLKKLLLDAPRSTTSVLYLRTMSKQVPSWDLLLAQDEQASRDLRSSTGYKGEVLVMEYPRNLRLFKKGLREETRKRLGLTPEDHVILYAPTWRKEDTTAKNAKDLPAYLLNPNTLAEQTGSKILFRSHHMTTARFEPSEAVIDVSREPRLEDLMVASDELISDYSSIFFDYALLNRPLTVHATDVTKYQQERGFYRSWPAQASMKYR